MQNKLGLTLIDSNVSNSAPFAYPGTVSSYKLYPGGQSYTVPIIQTTYGNPIQNVTLAPDQVNNPLGLFRSSSTLNIQNNVNITGTVISDSSNPDIQVYGSNVSWQPATLPALYGSNISYQLPSALVYDLRMNSGATVQLSGTTLVWHEFEIKQGAASSSLSFAGSLVANTLLLRGRTSWIQTPTTWNNDRSNWGGLNFFSPNFSLFFTDYMEKAKGFTVKPTLTFSPASGAVQPHWHDWSQPVYQPDPADPGLKWEVVRWEDNL
jgi:hypothetical protein